jgi:UDPglucose 6-dehydrogenase
LRKDIRAFLARAGELGADQALTFLNEVDNINMRRRIRMVELAREVRDGSLVGKRVAVLARRSRPAATTSAIPRRSTSPPSCRAPSCG